MRQQQSSKSPATIKPTSSAATSAATVEVPGQLNRHQGSNFTTAADWAAASSAYAANRSRDREASQQMQTRVAWSADAANKAGTEKLRSRCRQGGING